MLLIADLSLRAAYTSDRLDLVGLVSYGFLPLSWSVWIVLCILLPLDQGQRMPWRERCYKCTPPFLVSFFQFVSCAFILMICERTSLACVTDVIQKRLISFRKLGHLSHIIGNLLSVISMNHIQVLTVTLFPTSHEHRKFFDHLFRLVGLQGFLNVVKELQYLLKHWEWRLGITDLCLRGLFVLLDNHISQSLILGRILIFSIPTLGFDEVVFQLFDALLKNIVLCVRWTQEGATHPGYSRPTCRF